MYRSSLAAATLIALVGSVSCQVVGQDSAPSSHLVFNDRFDGDIIINQVRVPKDGEAMYTYYEALGWRGLGAGYAGIQAHPKGHNFIFSIWDHKQHTAPIKAVYRGPGTETEKFGGEGTGLKSWNFKLGWSTDVWYTLVARCWPVGKQTHFGFWVRSGKSGEWTHLVTMDVSAPRATFQGGTDTFIEDWLNTGAKSRTVHFRGGWKRKLSGEWFALTAGKYSVNAWDLERGKRSYHYRNNWNAGVARDATGKFYFLTSGGAKTKPTTDNPSQHAIARDDKKPDYEVIKIRRAIVARKDANTLRVSWEIDNKTTPQFAYRLEIYDNEAGSGKPLLATSHRIPHARTATVDVASLKPAGGRLYLHLKCTDILDRTSKAAVVRIPSASD